MEGGWEGGREGRLTDGLDLSCEGDKEHQDGFSDTRCMARMMKN